MPEIERRRDRIPMYGLVTQRDRTRIAEVGTWRGEGGTVGATPRIVEEIGGMAKRVKEGTEGREGRKDDYLKRNE